MTVTKVLKLFEPTMASIKEIREEEINNLPVMAKLFFLLRKSKKLSIAGLRFIF